MWGFWRRVFIMNVLVFFFFFPFQLITSPLFSLRRFHTMNVIARRLYSSSVETVGPALNNIVQRWPKMKELDRADIVDHLAVRSQLPWSQLSDDEKRAMYYISFGEWGPRSKIPTQSVSGRLLSGLFVGLLGVAGGVSVLNYLADKKHDERLENTMEKVKELKEKEAIDNTTKSNSPSNVKKYWLF